MRNIELNTWAGALENKSNHKSEFVLVGGDCVGRLSTLHAGLQFAHKTEMAETTDRMEVSKESLTKRSREKAKEHVCVTNPNIHILVSSPNIVVKCNLFVFSRRFIVRTFK